MIRARINAATLARCTIALRAKRLMWCGRFVSEWRPVEGGAELESIPVDEVEMALAEVLSAGWQQAIDARAAAGVH